MAKIQTLLFIAAILSLLNALPLEDDSSSNSNNGTQETPHDLKVNPLVNGSIQNDDDDNSTDEIFIEETHIEILLPNTPLFNTSALDAIFTGTNSTQANVSTADSQSRSARDTSSESDEDSKEDSTTVSNGSSTLGPPLLYSTQDSRYRVARDTSSNYSANYNISTIRPVLYFKRESGNGDDSSTEVSSEKQTNRPPLSLLSSSSQDSSGRVVRDTSNSSSNYSTGYNGSSTIRPVLYSAYAQNVKREAGNEDETGLPPGSTGRVIRDTSKASEQPSSNNPSHVPATSGRSATAPVLSSPQNANVQNKRNTEAERPRSSSAPGLNTEKVVYVTPQSKQLQQPQNPSAQTVVKH